MHVLVVGGNRFMGRELALRLLAAGHRVTVLNRGGHADPFHGLVETLLADRATDAFDRVLGDRSFDAAVDFACFEAAHAERAVGVLGGRVGHYVMISTGQVYLVRGGAPRPAAEVDYDGPLLPAPADAADRREWDYGMGKRGAEDVLDAAFRGQGFPATRLRIPMVNGARDYQRRLDGYLWRMLDGGPLLVPDGGVQATRHVYGSAVVRAIMDLLGDRDAFGRAWNLAQDETPTLFELLTVVADRLRARPSFVPVEPARLASAGLEPRQVSPFSTRWMSFLEPARARAELAFRHEPLGTYLDAIVAAFLAHPGEPPYPREQRDRERALAAAV